MGIKEFFEALFYICKDKKDKSLLFLGGILIFGYYFYDHFISKMVFDTQLFNYFSVLICICVILLIECFIILVLTSSILTIINKNKGLFSEHTSHVDVSLKSFTKDLNSIISHITDIFLVCHSTKDVIDKIDFEDETKIRNSIDMIHLMSEGLTVKYLNEMILYNTKIQKDISNDIDEATAKLVATQRLEQNLKGIKNSYIESTYASCDDLSIHIKNDIISLFNDHNLEIERIILSQKSMDEKLSSILILCKNFDTAMLTLCKKYLD